MNELEKKVEQIKEDFAAINKAVKTYGATAEVTPVMMMAVHYDVQWEPGTVVMAPRLWFEPYEHWGKGENDNFEGFEVLRMFFFREPREPHAPASEAFEVFDEACKRASAAIANRKLTPAEVVSLVRRELEAPATGAPLEARGSQAERPRPPAPRTSHRARPRAGAGRRPTRRKRTLSTSR